MKTIPLGINISNFIESYRSIGYTIETAIADIIDNSIFANATEIKINMLWPDYSCSNPFVQIIDDGIGMSNEELIESMRLACKAPSDYRDPTDLGRFGLGLKSASFSQCKKLTVGSQKEGLSPCCKQWDVSYICKTNEFLLNDCSLEESGIKEYIPSHHGTIVQWNEMDNLNIPEDISIQRKEQYWKDIKRKVLNHISMTFSSFMNNINFYFNDNPIEMWDPFMRDNDSTSILTDENIVFADNRNIKIKSYILPQKITEKDLKNLTRDRSLNDLQGFYLYRNNRLIIAGSWLGLKGLTKKEAYRLAHIRLDIDNTMDDLWHIDIKKEVAICPPELQEQLLSYAKHARTASAKVFRTRKKYIKSHNTIDEKKAYIWRAGTKNQKVFFEINRKNPTIESFFESLSTEQKRDFSSIIKYIENYIPVMSILEAESTSKDRYVNNNTEDINDEEIIESFKKTVETYVEKSADYVEAIKICAFTEPYYSNWAIIEPYIKSQGVDL